MEQPVRQTVLRRKAHAARNAHRARAMSAERAMRLALERCASGDLGFMLSVAGVETGTEMAEALAAALPDPALILLLDGPDGVPGAMILDMQMAAALIEAQTIGHVSARPAMARRPTRTDAAIAVPLVDGVLSRLVALLQDAGTWATGFGFGAMIEDGRALSLALGTGGYRVFRVGCDLGPDRAGEVVLALPDPPVPEDVTDGPDDAAPDRAGRPLRDSLLVAPARLDAVLCRVSLPLSQLRALREGEVLHLPAGVLSDTRLESVTGREVARATLGQIRGQRALRLHGGMSSRAGATGEDSATKTPAGDAPVAPPESAPAQVDRVDPGAGLPDLSEFDLPDDQDAPLAVAGTPLAIGNGGAGPGGG